MSVVETVPYSKKDLLLNSKVFYMEHSYFYHIIGDATGGWIVARLYFDYPTSGYLPADRYYLITNIWHRIIDLNFTTRELVDDQVAPITYYTFNKPNIEITGDFTNGAPYDTQYKLPSEVYLSDAGTQYLITPLNNYKQLLYLGKPTGSNAKVAFTFKPNTNGKFNQFFIKILSSKNPIPPEILLQFQ